MDIDIRALDCYQGRSTVVSRMCQMIASHIQNTSISILSTLISEWKSILDSPYNIACDDDGQNSGGHFDSSTVTTLKEQRKVVCNLERVLAHLTEECLTSDLSIKYGISNQDSLRSIRRKLETLELPDLQSTDCGVGNECPLRVDDAMACFIDDFNETLLSTVKALSSLQRPGDIPGVCMLSDASCALGNAYLNSNSRKMRVKYLHHCCDMIN